MTTVAPTKSIKKPITRPRQPSKGNSVSSSCTTTTTTTTTTTSATTATTVAAATSASCPEFRNGYRVQRRAYERRRSQTPTLETIITNRRPKNEYVDRLKQFYYEGSETHENGSSCVSHFPGDNVMHATIPGKHSTLPNRVNHPPDIKSILRLPDMKTSRAGRPNNNVKIALPAEVPVANVSNAVVRPSTVSLTGNKIPPPLPLQLLNAQSHQKDGEEYLSSSLTSSLASSILQAVNELRKTSSSGKSSNSSYQQQRQKRLRRASKNNGMSNKIDPKCLAMKMTLPCRIGCCYCVYSSILGPVKLFLTRSQTPKQGPWVAGIRDGHGRLVIPASRKGDVMGLVYNAHSHSLHPPAKGQRPMYPSANVRRGEKIGVTEKKRLKVKKKDDKRHS